MTPSRRASRAGKHHRRANQPSGAGGTYTAPVGTDNCLIGDARTASLQAAPPSRSGRNCYYTVQMRPQTVRRAAHCNR